VVVGVEVDVVEDRVVVDNPVVVVVTATVVEVFWLLPLLVGGRNSKTKAATMPNPAITARSLARHDHFVRDDLSSSGGGAGGSSEGGGP
jgi:hypothetical protein